MQVTEFILHRNPVEKEILTVLRSWILDLGPHCSEKISYKIPFYYFYGPICYLNPREGGVELSFAKGYQLSDESGLLERRNRKQVCSIQFQSVAELEEHEEEIRQLLNQAAILNEYLYKRKHKK